MSKVDLDFGDFTEKVVKKEAPPVDKQQQSTDKEPAIVKPTGYIVGTKVAEDGKFIPIDLADLNGEEFLKWAASVYPGQLTDNPKEYDSRINKVRVIENIIKFHELGFMSSKRPNQKDLLN